MKKIALIGMTLAGKTSVCHALKNMRPQDLVLDLDEYIERTFSITICEIFNKKNEDFFRELEQKSLNDILNQWNHPGYPEMRGKNLILSLGGGALKNLEIRNELETFDDIFYLKTTMEGLLERATEEELSKRPLFRRCLNAGGKYSKDLYSESVDRHGKYNLNCIRHALEEMEQRRGALYETVATKIIETNGEIFTVAGEIASIIETKA